jgi:hypothetical protein
VRRSKDDVLFKPEWLLLRMSKFINEQTTLGALVTRIGAPASGGFATNVGTVLNLVDAALLPRYMAQRFSRESRATINLVDIDLSRNFGVLVRGRQS